MITLSLCMIVKNEEKNLKNCLDSAKGIFDEIIITDTGSTDKTKDIAAEFTDKIYDFKWIDDFAAARNFSFSKASSEYIMWLDADDILPGETRTGLISIKSMLDKNVDVVRMPYHTGFRDGKPTFTYQRERILKNCENAVWKGFIHETITMFGNIISVSLPVEHHKNGTGDSDRNINLYEKHIAMGEELSPRDMFYYGRELFYHNRNHDAVEVLTKFINSKKGWVENNIDACRIRSECFERMGEQGNAFMSLFETLIYDTPRAETSCEIGRQFMKINAYKQAIYWYSCALSEEPDYDSGAFILPDCYGYLPAIQICVCYSKLGDEKTAYKYNEIAAEFKVTDSIIYNRNWFKSIGVGEDT
ncbi:MAG: glycosyltransferase [Ruminococcus sp.]|nr:glycosyltransferase [Ruminococcus sp.]